MSDKKFYGIIIGFCVAISLALLVIITIFLTSDTTNFVPKKVEKLTTANSSSSSAPNYLFFSQLDGRAVSTTEDIVPQVVGVMIDNHPDARPESGLSQARVVYEVPVESPYTRYFAVFNSSDTIEQVGPVRSARPYFLDINREYGDSPYLHSGGSPEALSLLKTGIVWDINEFYWGSSFWRDSAHTAPHNLFTKSASWQALLAKSVGKRPKVTWQGWSFLPYGSDDALGLLQPFVSSSNPEVNHSVKIHYNSGYTPSWEYDEMVGLYRRSINGVLFKNENSSPLTAQTILVQVVPIRSIDADDRKKIDLVGSGKGYVVSKGQVVRALWKKESVSSRTRWYDAQNKEIQFVPGTVWVEVVSPNTMVDVAP
jgi:hypothetical protein